MAEGHGHPLVFIMFNSNPTKFRVFSVYPCWVLYFFLGVFYTVPILESFENILQTFETTKLEKDPLGLFIDFYYLWFWVLEDFQNQGTAGFQSLKFFYTDIQFRVFENLEGLAKNHQFRPGSLNSFFFFFRE